MSALRQGICDQPGCGRSGMVIAKVLPSSGRWCDRCNKKRLEEAKKEKAALVELGPSVERPQPVFNKKLVDDAIARFKKKAEKMTPAELDEQERSMDGVLEAMNDIEKRAKKKSSPGAAPKGEISRLVKELDRVFSIFIRKRSILFSQEDYALCFTCGLTDYWKNMECGHWQKRGNFAIRWDERNCAAQCKSCNRMEDGRYAEFEQEIRSQYGDEAVTDLLRLKNDTSFKLDRMWLKEKIEYYKNLVKE